MADMSHMKKILSAMAEKKIIFYVSCKKINDPLHSEKLEVNNILSAGPLVYIHAYIYIYIYIHAYIYI